MYRPTKLLTAINNLFHQKANEKDVEEINDWYHGNQHPVSLEEDEIVKTKIWQHIQRKKSKKTRNWKLSYAAAAASLAFVIGITWYLFLNPTADANPIAYHGPQQGANIIYDDASSETKTPSKIKLIEVTKGQQYTTLLPDGTEVKLNADSKLELLQFDDDERRVRLTGEGFFHVTKNEKRPFIVETNKQTITVLGTKFNIRSYDDSTEELSLVEGKVKTQINDEELFLSPGESMRIGVNEATKVEVSKSKLMWTEEVFAFEEQTLSEILKNVSRWYNVPYQAIEDDEKHFTGKIRSKATLEEVLQLIRIVSQRDVQFINNQVIIK